MKWCYRKLLIVGAFFTAFGLNHSVVSAEGLTTNTSVVYDMGKAFATQIPANTTGYKNPLNPYKDLKVPAQITKQGDYYFIVDTYHDQVIYSSSPGAPLEQWRVMTSDVTLPHAIASDGERYLVTDTENNRILVFEWKYGRFQNTQQFHNIGERPHYIKYDVDTDSFFVWSSMTGDMYIIKNDPVSAQMYIQEIRHIYELENFYVRSFTISGDLILFPSGNNGYMMLADKQTLEVKGRYPVSPEIAGMAYVLPVEDYFYITVSTDLVGDQNYATMIRTNDLSSLAMGKYEDVYDVFGGKGVPYYIDMINGTYYMTNHADQNAVLKFRIENNVLIKTGVQY